MATFWNSKKKDWFSHETLLVFVYGDVFKDGSKNPVTFKMELFATIGNGMVYNQWTVVFACCCGNSTIFTGKIKIRWKRLCLEGGIRYDFLFWRHVFKFFQKRQLLSVSLTFCFISKITYKNENWYHCRFLVRNKTATQAIFSFSVFHSNTILIPKFCHLTTCGNWVLGPPFLRWSNRSNHQHMFWKMLLIKCRKNSCEGTFLPK